MSKIYRINEFAKRIGKASSSVRQMVEDLMAIVHTFNSRLYGLRSYKKQIQQAALGESNADSIQQESN